MCGLRTEMVLSEIVSWKLHGAALLKLYCGDETGVCEVEIVLCKAAVMS